MESAASVAQCECFARSKSPMIPIRSDVFITRARLFYFARFASNSSAGKPMSSRLK